jgi:hypothetical protein
VHGYPVRYWGSRYRTDGLLTWLLLVWHYGYPQASWDFCPVAMTELGKATSIFAPSSAIIVLRKLRAVGRRKVPGTEGGNQSCPEASIPDLAVRIIRLFEQSSLGFSESKLALVFPVVKGCVLGCNIRKRRI